MTRQDLAALLDFHYWARDRMLEAAGRLAPEQFTSDLGSSFASVRDTIVHLYEADWIWHQRWTGTSPTGGPATGDWRDVGTVASAWRDLEAEVRAMVAGLDEAGVTREVEYRTLKGLAGRLPFWQLVQHVVNHGTYHRGQVTTMLRQLGAPPPAGTDLFTYYRERQG
ncbi:MAG: DinB family protein [Vicinamibacterales bacterium]